jgi:hypothetical protein
MSVLTLTVLTLTAISRRLPASLALRPLIQRFLREGAYCRISGWWATTT